jgi:hypothetical protein
VLVANYLLVASSLLVDVGAPTVRITLRSKATPARDAGPAIGNARLYCPLAGVPKVLAMLLLS